MRLIIGICMMVMVVASAAPLMASVSQEQSTQLEVVGYSVWKAQQVVYAQNLVVRLANKIQLNRKKNGKQEGQADLSTADEKLEQKKLKGHLDSLQFAKDLSFHDYVVNYLGQFERDDQSLSEVLKKFSKEELLLVLKEHIKTQRAQSVVSRPRMTGLHSSKSLRPSL